MNRQQLRNEHKRVKRMKTAEFIDFMNQFHSDAYYLAEKHFDEAMDIILTPKQKTAVRMKSKEIRELWDGIQEITPEVTKG